MHQHGKIGGHDDAMPTLQNNAQNRQAKPAVLVMTLTQLNKPVFFTGANPWQI